MPLCLCYYFSEKSLYANFLPCQFYTLTCILVILSSFPPTRGNITLLHKIHSDNCILDVPSLRDLRLLIFTYLTYIFNTFLFIALFLSTFKYFKFHSPPPRPEENSLFSSSIHNAGLKSKSHSFLNDLF